MFSRSSTDRYGLLVDIGSGSVGLAICHSVAGEKKSTIVWSHREHSPLRDIESVSDSSKAIITTLMSTMMVFDGEGRTALHNYQKGAKVQVMQVTVAAPWAYTTTRTIKFEQDEPFEITNQILSDLATAAGQQAIDEFNSQHSLTSLGITETSRCALDTYANGYRLTNPNKQHAKEVSVTHATTLVRTEISDAISEMHEKLFSAVPLQTTSYMLANYFATRLLIPHIYDVCLVDITDEATEIGIVRDGSLQYSTHAAFGRSSLAREIAAAGNIPLSEAFSKLKSMSTDKFATKYKELLDSYVEQVHELLKETGDRLTIPKNIYLQTDVGLEHFFSPLIEKAGKLASKGNVKVTDIHLEFKRKKEDGVPVDTALLVAARFFHTAGTRSHFEYL